jgi:hypothetical protein
VINAAFKLGLGPGHVSGDRFSSRAKEQSAHDCRLTLRNKTLFKNPGRHIE